MHPAKADIFTHCLSCPIATAIVASTMSTPVIGTARPMRASAGAALIYSGLYGRKRKMSGADIATPAPRGAMTSNIMVRVRMEDLLNSVSDLTYISHNMG